MPFWSKDFLAYLSYEVTRAPVFETQHQKFITQVEKVWAQRDPSLPRSPGESLRSIPATDKPPVSQQGANERGSSIPPIPAIKAGVPTLGSPADILESTFNL